MSTSEYDDACLRLCTRTFEAMGTVISISAPLDADEVAVATEAAERVFVDAEERFSPFLNSSELSKVNRGEVLLPDASSAMREVYALALEFEYRTQHRFTPYSPSGDLDLNGVVKAWAIREAGHVMDTVGIPHWSINAGGDLLVSGSPTPSQPSLVDPQYGTPFFGTPWQLGIVDPQNPRELLSSIEATGTPGFHTALATSGSAERGDHIWGDSSAGDSSARGSSASELSHLLQVSVTGPDIVTADALATALAAGGRVAFSLLNEFPGYESLGVLEDGSLVRSSGWPVAA
ncbi:FAD:protein FMN transferase [Neomicrococcus aestuarii]|uniref:FAD:protein FMN transferase n=1 Tax=Neomicrococcus aestuarii TaxID=556325 RepID=A0A1L2ZQ40_9MICC|nr:FAD:protein FMN transferase [Neomicrococcus aestuarii]APF41306.1 hypothetical protein BHE16_10235 [Neomicrococcus aestuarii]